MRGSLREAPVTDIFQLLHIGKKTGKLSITNGNDFLEIFFKEGIVIYASMVNKKERLGDFLLKDNILDQSTVKKAVSHVERGYPNLGFAFIEMGVDQGLVKKYKEKEIIEYLQESLLWKEGFFNFTPDEYPKQRPLIEIDPSRFLIESITKYDEWEKVKEIIFPLDTVLTKNYGIDESTLAEKQKLIYNIVDGEKDIKEIIESSGMPLIEAAEILQDLVSKRIVRKHAPLKASVTYEREKIAEHLNLGFAFLKINLFEEAEREFRRVIEIAPDSAEGYFALGVLNIYNNRLDEAKQFFDKAKQILPDNTKILHNLAFVYYRLNDTENARKIMENIFTQGKIDKKERLLKSIIDYKMGRVDVAREDFKSLIKEFPDLKTSFLYLASIYIYEKRYLNAQEILNFLEKNDPENRNLLIIRSLVLYFLQKYDRTIEVATKGLEIYPDEWRFDFIIAESYYAVGDMQNAIVCYEKTVQKKKHFKSLFRLGILYLKEGMKGKTLEYWKQAESIDPDNKLLRRNLELLKKSQLDE